MLVAEELFFSFGNRKIIDGVSFELVPGTVTCLLGGNGSGKTTLLNLITGYLPIKTGSIRWNGVELVGLPSFQIARLGVTRTFQNQRLIGMISVVENILLAAQSAEEERLSAAFPIHRNRSNEEARRNAAELMNIYSLADVANRPACSISHGQQKLLTLACCEALRPRLLLLDEPVAGISPELRVQIAQRLLQIRAQGTTLLLIEHQADFLEHVGDRYIFLDAGKLKYYESLSEVWDSTSASELID